MLICLIVIVFLVITIVVNLLRIDKLKKIIRSEGEKWYNYHTDVDRKQYWLDYARKSNEN